MKNLAAFHPETHSAEQVIETLGLQPLDREGGYFRRTAQAGLAAATEKSRAYSVIYALFTPTAFSALHVLATDEIWCWHAGVSLESLRLEPDGTGHWVRLGMNLGASERPQDRVPAGVWQGARPVGDGPWTLVSCVMAPEFRWSDFTLGERDDLVARYPEWRTDITALTRPHPALGKL